MSCREYEADIVELARGSGLTTEVEARLREHLEECAGCAARLRPRAATDGRTQGGRRLRAATFPF